MHFNSKKISVAVFGILLILLFMPYNYVQAEEPTTILNIEVPANLSSKSGDVQVSGFAVSKNTITKAEIYVDGKLVAPATYGQSRTDVGSQYPTYSNSSQSGFNYNLNSRGYADGQHEIKVETTDNASNKVSKSVTVNLTNQRTPIMGQAIVTKEQMIKYFQQNNSIKSFDYINSFVSILLEEASIEGVRPDAAFAQMMKETNFLKFTGTVKEEQNNFAGLGATGRAVTGASFPDIRTGIRAVIQHLKCYASTDSIKQTIVDPRYAEWLRGKAPYIEWLGTTENPYGAGWATDDNYGYDIVNRVNYMKNITVTTYPASISNFSTPDIAYVGKTVTGTVTGTAPNKALYAYFVKDESTGIWETISWYTDKNTFTWTPKKPGQYTFEVYIKDELSSNTRDMYTRRSCEVKSVETTSTITKFNTPDTEVAGKAVTGTVEATTANKALYAYFVKDESTGVWETISWYTDKNSFSWTPKKPGNYTFEVYLKDEASSNTRDTYTRRSFVATNPQASVSNLTTPSEGYIGKAVTGSVSASSQNKVQYAYFVKDESTGVWETISWYTDKNTFTWTPTKAGSYIFETYVKDELSTNTRDAYTRRNITINVPTATITRFDAPSETYIGKDTIASLDSVSPNSVQYAYFIKDNSTGVWTTLSWYVDSNIVSWTPSKQGSYILEVYAKDKYSVYNRDNYVRKDITVKVPVAGVSSISVPSEGTAGKSITATVSAYSQSKVQYAYFLKDNSTGVWTTLSWYGDSNTITWTPKKAGEYTLEAYVKDKYNSNDRDASIRATIIVKSNKTIVLDAGHGGSDPGAQGNGYNEKDLNMLIVQKLGSKLVDLGFNVLYTRQPSNDTYVSLEDRASFANNNNADLFISIHHDSSTSSSAAGTSTHYSSFRPGLDIKDAYVEYNGKKYPVLYEDSGIIYYSDNGVKKSVSVNDATAYDPTPTDAAAKSATLANDIVNAISSLGLNNRGSRDHNLYVTRWTNMPSILVEAGFISNSSEISKISASSFQDAIAQKIAGILSVFFSM
jgi:N-acetylmuramoyl-L-alanine amidase